MSANAHTDIAELAPAARADSIDTGARGTRQRWRLAVSGLALAAAGLVLLSTAKYGAGLSSDSVAYYDIARSLMSGKGLVFHTGEPLVWWPPLYPLLLALVGSVTGLDPGAFTHVVNAVLFALVVCLSGSLFRPAFMQDAVYGLLGVSAVLFSLPLCGVYAMAWSECLFIVLVLFYLVSVQRYWGDFSMLSLALMMFSTALACLTRYIGVTLVLAGVLAIMLAPGLDLRTRFTRAFLFAVVSLLPLALWLAHNCQQAGTLSGARFHSGFDFVPNVILMAMTVLLWYEPVGMVMRFVPASVARTVSPAGWSLTLAASLCAGLAASVALTAALVLSPAMRRRLARAARAVLSGHPATALFLAVYLFVLLALASRGASSYVDGRLLSPVYVPFTLVLLLLVLRSQDRTSLPGAPANRGVATLLLALWLCLSYQRVVAATVDRFRNGAGGYSTTIWHESETVADIKQKLSTDTDVQVYSNGPDALWALASLNATMTPYRTEVGLRDLKGRWPAENGSILVWFRNITQRPYLFSTAELGSIADVEEVAHFSDGSIYRISTRGGAAPAVQDGSQADRPPTGNAPGLPGRPSSGH